jgi:PHD/YefM family antitoxin component YafN of YafNO toxin-antitoxin module
MQKDEPTNDPDMLDEYNFSGGVRGKYAQNGMPVRTISAQDIKRRGISAVDDLLREGPVHVIQRKRPRYVILDEAQYEEMLEERHEAFIARVKESLAEIEAGQVTRYDTTEELMAAIDRCDDE